MNNKSNFSSYQIMVLILLALVQFTVILDFAILSPLGEIMVKDLHITTSQFGIVVSAYAFSAAISAILSSGFSDKYDRKKFLLFMYSGFILGTLFCGLASSYTQLLLARIVTGFFGGVMSSVVLTILADVFPNNVRGSAMSYIQMAFAVGQIAGIPAGLFVASKINWNATFIMIVGIAIINLLLIFFKLKPLTEHLTKQFSIHPFTKLLNTLKNKRHITGLSAVAFVSIGGFILMPFMSLFVVNNLGISRANVPFIFMLTGIFSLIFMPIVGKLSDKYSRYTIFLIGSLLAILFVNIYVHLVSVPFWIVVLINILVFSCVAMRNTPFMTMNTAVPEIENRGSYLSLSSATQQIGGGLGSIVGGYIVSQTSEIAPLENMDVLGLVMTGVISLSLILVFRVSKVVTL